MTGYSFQEGIPEGFSPGFDIGIFQDPRHLYLQSPAGWHTFVVLNHSQASMDAMIHVHISGDQANSPLRSPYGSFIFSEAMAAEVLTGFIGFVEGQLKSRNISRLTLKNAPQVYGHGELLEKLLVASGFEIESEESSSVIPVTEKSFDESLHRTKKARLKKGIEHEFTVERLSHDTFGDVFDFIKTCREKKGYSLSMSASDLKKVLEVFPDSFFLHALSVNQKMIASSISIRVEPLILYTFYYDHDAAYNHLSPVVMLMSGIYESCQSEGIRLLDLGTSNIDGKLSASLLDFKLSLGASPSRKLTFVKHFH